VYFSVIFPMVSDMGSFLLIAFLSPLFVIVVSIVLYKGFIKIGSPEHDQVKEAKGNKGNEQGPYPGRDRFWGFRTPNNKFIVRFAAIGVYSDRDMGVHHLVIRKSYYGDLGAVPYLKRDHFDSFAPFR